MRKIKVILAVIASMLAVMLTGTGTAMAAGPSTWEFGAYPGDNCTGTLYPSSTWPYQDCSYSAVDSTFRLDSADGKAMLTYRPVDRGNLVGWNIGTSGYWMQSNTTDTGFRMVLQHDCNQVVYDRATGRAIWAVGSQSSDPNLDDCRIRMLTSSTGKHYYIIDVHSSTAGWWAQCSVPNGYIGVTCNEGPR